MSKQLLNTLDRLFLWEKGRPTRKNRLFSEDWVKCKLTTYGAVLGKIYPGRSKGVKVHDHCRCVGPIEIEFS